MNQNDLIKKMNDVSSELLREKGYLSSSRNSLDWLIKELLDK